MQLILLGPPGSGKGTLAADLEQLYEIPHISTGDIFRRNIREKTALGQEAETYIDSGALVPDALTITMVADRLEQDDCKRGFLLDGFPRTIVQADALARLNALQDKPLTAVLNLIVRDETILKRLSGRRMCPRCGRGYNIHSQKPRAAGICDDCQVTLVQRADDKEETILKRLQTYKEQTEPLIAYYRERGLLIDADNEGTIEACFQTVRQLLDDRLGRA
ncbi:MAG: adenylate kinase [Clostridiaceae bacterium]|nr:adenylate kinase [Eubacteriales bacterium]MDD4138616.1 adenylate kinase [Eubacteriales bacterium]MDD4744993.1 adenylate kinase [Eubacteriales bacterium]NLB44326.1 adenylate kinase [Clostridiaceae bacterium]